MPANGPPLQRLQAKNTCGKNGCTYKHHQTLHEDKALTKSVTPSGVSGTINACQQIEKSAYIFQVQRIRTKKSWMNVMWDSAASLCFITNEKAKAETLQGKEVELTITKVGGETEKLQTYKYNLPLIDLKGDQVIPRSIRDRKNNKRYSGYRINVHREYV